jgi:hypothetical protein
LKDNESRKKFQVSHKNEDITYQNLWDTAKVAFKGKFIAMSTHIRKLRETSDK